MTTFDWLARTFEKPFGVAKATVSGSRLLVERTDGSTVTFALVSVPVVDAATVESSHQGHPDAQFLVSVPKSARILGEAFRAAELRRIGLGRVGDGMRASLLEEPHKYINPEVGFVLRGLRQHSSVREVERLDDLRLEVQRFIAPSIVVYVCSDYEPTADAVRTAIDEYAPFDVFLSSNPNGNGASTEAIDAAASAGIKVSRWKPLLSELGNN